MSDRRVAYFSMEIGLGSALPTYAGGLGILAGDTIRAAADRRVPMVAVTLLYRKGHFRQRLGADGSQQEEARMWSPEAHLAERPERVSVSIEGRIVRLRSWQYEVSGHGGYRIPVYFLDSNLEENDPWDRTLTDHLYGGDGRYRLSQEIVLGIGGLRMLGALGHGNLERFHMNEGHSSLLTLELLDERLRSTCRRQVTRDDIYAVRDRCVFTTHTPVSSGHDRFPLELAAKVLGEALLQKVREWCCHEQMINMTLLALNFSRYVNGVARKHGELSRLMFDGHDVDSITNGVHAGTWTSEPFQALYDRHIPGWRRDPLTLRYTSGIPLAEISEAHRACKQQLVDHVHRMTGAAFDPARFTIGCARRMTGYKRSDLLLHDRERLLRVASSAGPIQIVFAGKAHPNDEEGKEMIRRIIEVGRTLPESVHLAFLADYDIEDARLLTAGADLWLNTPIPPLEASGTSGMKAALNGVPSFSTLDGWWIEGHLEGVTGWSIGEAGRPAADVDDRAVDAAALYDKLEGIILPLFRDDPDGYLRIMRNAISLNGSFFNAHRMIGEYRIKAYR